MLFDFTVHSLCNSTVVAADIITSTMMVTLTAQYTLLTEVETEIAKTVVLTDITVHPFNSGGNWHHL